MHSVRVNQSPKYSEMDASDPRCKLAKMKGKGIKSEQYWDLFRECDIKFESGTASVNGTSTKLPHFAEAVLMSIDELGIVSITHSTETEE